MTKLQLIDTHAHLDDPRFDSDRNEVLKRAEEAGVKNIISVGCWNPRSGFTKLEEIVKSDPRIFSALGIHPHDAKDATDEAFNAIKTLALKPEMKVAAIGETGLDYHYDNSPREIQKEVFKRHIALARELNLPLIVHTREADKDTIEVMRGEGAAEAGGVLHCFSGSEELADEARELGFYLSFTGVITFPNAEKLRAIIKKTPIERMLVETDCPYLAPVPERGKRCEPAYVAHTAKAIADIKGLSLSDVARITTLNAEDLFVLKKGERDIKIAYPIRNSLYLNVTNRCTNYCTFCAKFKSYTVKGHYLRLREEPDFAQIIAAIGPEPEEKYDEIVFCGFGEPLIRLDVVKQVGKHLKRRGCRIRIDTDGLANLVHGGNVLQDLMFVDVISVSMNAPDSDTYQKLIKTPYGDKAFPAILYFLREAKKFIPKVIATVVAVPGLDIEACRKVAEDDIGVGFRVREYNEVG